VACIDASSGPQAVASRAAASDVISSLNTRIPWPVNGFGQL
jgi:hypothetical protein